MEHYVDSHDAVDDTSYAETTIDISILSETKNHALIFSKDTSSLTSNIEKIKYYYLCTNGGRCLSISSCASGFTIIANKGAGTTACCIETSLINHAPMSCVIAGIAACVSLGIVLQEESSIDTISEKLRSHCLKQIALILAIDPNKTSEYMSNILESMTSWIEQFEKKYYGAINTYYIPELRITTGKHIVAILHVNIYSNNLTEQEKDFQDFITTPLYNGNLCCKQKLPLLHLDNDQITKTGYLITPKVTQPRPSHHAACNQKKNIEYGTFNTVK